VARQREDEESVGADGPARVRHGVAARRARRPLSVPPRRGRARRLPPGSTRRARRTAHTNRSQHEPDHAFYTHIEVGLETPGAARTFRRGDALPPCRVTRTASPLRRQGDKSATAARSRGAHRRPADSAWISRREHESALIGAQTRRSGRKEASRGLDRERGDTFPLPHDGAAHGLGCSTVIRGGRASAEGRVATSIGRIGSAGPGC